MRESSVVKELLEKERAQATAQATAQAVLFALEVKLGILDDDIKNRILAFRDDEELLNHLHRQSIIAEKDQLEKEVRLLCR